MNPGNLMSQLSNTMAQGQSPMNVQTPGSPMFDPNLVTPSPTPMPDKSPVTSMHLHQAFQRRGMPVPAQLQSGGQEITLPIQDQNPAQPGVQIPMSEAELIIKTLGKRLEHKSKMEASTLPKPDFNQSPTAGQSAQLK